MENLPSWRSSMGQRGNTWQRTLISRLCTEGFRQKQTHQKSSIDTSIQTALNRRSGFDFFESQLDVYLKGFKSFDKLHLLKGLCCEQGGFAKHEMVEIRKLLGKPRL